ncbi:hypothetical protein Tco_0184206 [Tanacetum coccineum]
MSDGQRFMVRVVEDNERKHEDLKLKEEVNSTSSLPIHTMLSGDHRGWQKPSAVARTTTNADGTSTSTIPGAVTAEEKIQKKNDLKARILSYNTARLSDTTIYAFLANQPNGSQVVHEDLEQIHEGD